MAEFTATLKGSESGARYFAGVRSWLDENGMSIDADSFLGRPEQCVVLIPRVLQPNADRVGPQFVFTGPCIDETRMTGWTPDGDGPLAYVAFGTAYTDNLEIYRACVEALKGYRLIIATGKVDPAELGVGERTQPQLDVLAHADVFVTHAGMGSASESLWFGVPTVAIPQAVDQFTNAAQLEAAGAGVHLSAEQVTAESLRDAVARAVAQAPRARELQEEVRRSGGIAATADTVERLVGVDPIRLNLGWGGADLKGVSQISMPMRILLVGAVVFLAAWFTVLKPKPAEFAPTTTSTTPPVTTAGKAVDAAKAAAGQTTETTKTDTDTAPATTTAPSSAPEAAPAVAIPAEALAKLPKDVAARSKRARSWSSVCSAKRPSRGARCPTTTVTCATPCARRTATTAASSPRTSSSRIFRPTAR